MSLEQSYYRLKACQILHYENLPMQYTEIFLALKVEHFQLKNFVIFLIFIGIPLHTPVLLYKSGVQEGIHYTDMCS